MNSSDPDGMLLESITPAEPSSALFALLSGLASVSSEICACGVALSRASDVPGTLSTSPASPAPCSSKESTSTSIENSLTTSLEPCSSESSASILKATEYP